MLQDQATTSPASEKLIGLIQSKLNAIDGLFVTPKNLFEIGLFCSTSAASKAITSGAIPHVRISPYRVLVGKDDVLDFVQGCFRGGRAA
jgi:hypothetical protein